MLEELKNVKVLNEVELGMNDFAEEVYDENDNPFNQCLVNKVTGLSYYDEIDDASIEPWQYDC